MSSVNETVSEISAGSKVAVNRCPHSESLTGLKKTSMTLLRELITLYELKKHNVNGEDRIFILSLVQGYKALNDDKQAIGLRKYSGKDIMLFFKGNRVLYIFSRNIFINIVSFTIKIAPISRHRIYIFVVSLRVFIIDLHVI